jgi:demethylmenaquinone methyltransferase/2-methoxy-6-polyprenyl-1,4-benzoquinol methylase
MGMQRSRIPDTFSGIAPRYDLLNHLLSLNIDRVWRRRLVEAAGVRQGGRVLDACAGTCDVAIAFVEGGGAAEVVAVDLSQGMLRRGKEKLERRRVSARVRLVEGDATRLPFGTGVFDAASIAFGLRNLTDYAAGLSEIARVLKPAGRLAMLEFAPPSAGLRGRAYAFYLGKVIPRIGRIVSGSEEAYRYLASSVKEFLPEERVLDLMAGAGFRNLSAKSLTDGIVYVYYGEK